MQRSYVLEKVVIKRPVLYLRSPTISKTLCRNMHPTPHISDRPELSLQILFSSSEEWALEQKPSQAQFSVVSTWNS